jgi:hypothetical protein
MPTEPSPAPPPLTRSTPRQGDHPQPASLYHRPSVVAISERKRADFWKNMALGVCLLALLLTFLIVRAARSTELIHVMDPLGNMYAGPVEPLADSKKFFNLSAIYATNAALQRSSSGFDLFELLKLYFTPRAIAKLEDDQKLRQEDIHRRNLQWKPMIDSIGDPVAAGAARLVEVHGRVIVAGAYANRSFYEEIPFVVVLTMIRNADIGKSGAYPWVCNDIDLKLAQPASRR